MASYQNRVQKLRDKYPTEANPHQADGRMGSRGRRFGDPKNLSKSNILERSEGSKKFNESMATVKSKLGGSRLIENPSLISEKYPTSSNFSQKPLNRVAERSRSSKKRFDEFYQQQLQYQDHKNSKIRLQLERREKLVEDLRNQKNRFSLISSGSRKILNRSSKRNQSRGQKLSNMTQINERRNYQHYNKYSIDFRSPQSLENTSLVSVHDRLFNES